jgi:aspartyl-tRNA(Asn)/glutamyl-tRNA(Gln) amidotransferase subunit B
MSRADWEAVIGMEVHAQLATRSKMFCGCSTDYMGAPPNSRVCEVCLGMPGVLPVVNRKAIELGVRTGLALGCEIARHTRFDRKNYFYPDLPKGYQISQYQLPIAERGELRVNGHTIRVSRVHLEEDTGKLSHEGDALEGAGESLVDLNRSGMPLMEVVTEPDIHTAEEARGYAMALRAILRAVGASEAEMDKGQLRAESNVSVRRRGDPKLGVKTELKNINSFRALQRAVDSEIERQIEVLESGGLVVQETRGWSDAEQRTFSQRSKEQAHDYRYFPEPDLPPLELDPAWVETLRADLPELPAALRARLVERHVLSEWDADQLTEDGAAARLFEATVTAGAPPKQAANWIIRSRPSIGAEHLAELIDLVRRGTITRDQGTQVLEESQTSGRPPSEIVRERGLAQVSDESALAGTVATVLEQNPKVVADYRAGNDRALNVLIGKVMGATRGAANAKLAGDLLRRSLIR